MNLRLASALATIALGAAACCAGMGTLDHKKVENDITTELAKKEVKMTSVTCPEGRKLHAGDTFDCTGKDEDGESLTFHVTQPDDKGSFNWKLDGMIINKKKVGDSIEASFHEPADVTCPEKAVILKVGQSFTCDVTLKGKSHKVDLTLVDDTGKVSWKMKT